MITYWDVFYVQGLGLHHSSTSKSMIRDLEIRLIVGQAADLWHATSLEPKVPRRRLAHQLCGIRQHARQSARTSSAGAQRRA